MCQMGKGFGINGISTNVDFNEWATVEEEKARIKW